VPAEDVNIQTSIAKCRACGAVFGFAGQVGGGTFAGSAKRTVDMPPGYTVDMQGVELVITRRWFSPTFIFLLFFCIFWDGFLVFWYINALKPGALLMMKLFPLLHVGVGLGLTYLTAAGFINRTRVRVGPAELNIKHYPLPWPGNRTLQRQEIDQLFCEERVDSGRNGVSYTYTLSVVGPGGKRLRLIKGLASPEDALFLEQKIEGYLGITDRPVAGEMRPV